MEKEIIPGNQLEEFQTYESNTPVTDKCNRSKWKATPGSPVGGLHLTPADAGLH